MLDDFVYLRINSLAIENKSATQQCDKNNKQHFVRSFFLSFFRSIRPNPLMMLMVQQQQKIAKTIFKKWFGSQCDQIR